MSATFEGLNFALGIRDLRLEFLSISQTLNKTRKNINFGTNVSAGRYKKISKVPAEIVSCAKPEFKYRVVWPSDIWQILSTPIAGVKLPLRW